MNDGGPFFILARRTQGQVKASLSHALFLLQRRDDLSSSRWDVSSPVAGCGDLDKAGIDRSAKTGGGSAWLRAVWMVSVGGGRPESGVRMHHCFTLAGSPWTSLREYLQNNTWDILIHIMY